jgi:RNA polymerase sigma-70 factor (ECF subfamily)
VIKDILSGNTALFEILIRRYNPFLYKIGRSYGFNHHDTEDLMQEAFVNSYLNLKQFAERSSFKNMDNKNNA